MSFDDFPQVDLYSKYSERSEISLRSILNQDAGFICRPDIPDKGCDFLVEMIIGGQNAVNWRFCLQLKSIEKLRKVENDEFIAYPLLTSRLRYVMEFPPAMGLIVFYSVEEAACFYDYADKVYERLMEERGSADWQANESVVIRIPFVNRLNTDTAVQIHKVFYQRFERAARMQQSFGNKYGLPTFDRNGQSEYDFNNLSDIKRFLNDYGIMLIDHYDLDMVFTMISQIPHFEISQSKDLLYIASIAYAESGHSADSEFFCTKLLRWNLNADERGMISFVRAKNKLSLGYITSEEYEKLLENLLQVASSPTDKVVLALNIIYAQLLRARALVGNLSTIERDIEKLFKDIEALDVNIRRKGLFTVWNAENLAFFIIKRAADYTSEHQIREAARSPLDANIRSLYATHLTQLEQNLRVITSRIVKQAFDENDIYLQGHILTLEVAYFLQRHIQYISFDIPLPRPGTDLEEHFRVMLRCAQGACDIFNHMKMFKDSLKNVCQVIEIMELAERSFDIQLEADIEQYYDRKEALEKELGIPSSEIIFASLVRPKPSTRAAFDRENLRLYAFMSDEQISRIVEFQVSALQLLPEDGVFIESFFKKFRLFYQRCADDSHEMQVFADDADEANIFNAQIKFIVRNKKTGVVTGPSSDVEQLLTSIGY